MHGHMNVKFKRIIHYIQWQLQSSPLKFLMTLLKRNSVRNSQHWQVRWLATHQRTWSHVSEDLRPQQQSCENLKYHVPNLTDWDSYLTLSWPAGHICPTCKESFQVRLDNSIPLFLHAAIYLEVSLFRWTSQNAFSREQPCTNDTVCSVAMQHCTLYHLYSGKCILTGSTE
jgi:hypothetical protein